MELGQIKLDYNNEALKIKKHFIQAKTQCINNLSRKGKQMKSRQASDKCPDEIKEKNKRKLETIVAEIFIMKKLKYDELARFAMLNFEKLTKIMDSPVASKEKAMAKIIAHKSLKSKFLLIKEKFSHVPTDKLLELDPRKQRKKKKKEQSKLKQSELEKSTPNTDIPKTPKIKLISNIESLDEDGDEALNKFYNSNKSIVKPTDDSDDEELETGSENTDDDDDDEIESSQTKKIENEAEVKDYNSPGSDDDDDVPQSDFSIPDTESIEKEDHRDTGSDIKSKMNILELPKKSLKNKHKDNRMLTDMDDGNVNILQTDILSDGVVNNSETSVNHVSTKPEKASKTKHKDKRMFVDMDDDNINISSQKIVDSFFMTDSGDNYLTVAIPRPPDVTNDDGDQYNTTNRRLRRAAMFGTSVAPRNKKSFEPKQYTSRQTTDFKGNRNFTENSKQDKYSPRFNNKTDNSFQNNSHFKNNDRAAPSVNKVPEKLHPSWEAKKQKMSILPFQGNKIMFND